MALIRATKTLSSAIMGKPKGEVLVLKFVYQGLSEWYQTRLGRWLLSLEIAELRRYLLATPLQHILQIGGDPELLGVAEKHLAYHYFLDQCVKKQTDFTLCADFEELPLQPDSLNGIVIAHALEFCEHPTVLLRNCYEALTPGGDLIIFCFNRWSSWNLYKSLSGKKTAPWSGKFYSPSSLKARLKMLNFEIKIEKTFCFRPPFQIQPKKNRLRFFESLGQLTLGNLGAVNLIVANKKMFSPLIQKAHNWEEIKARDNSIAEANFFNQE